MLVHDAGEEGLRGRRPGPAVAALGGGLLALFAITTLFAGALHRPRPHDVPVAVVAPPGARSQLGTGIARTAPGVFDLRPYRSEAHARRALSDHEVDGVLVLAGSRPRLLVAGAAGDAPAQLLTTAFGAAAHHSGHALSVRDVRPFPASDPRGLGAFFVVLGLVISGVVFGAISTFRGRALAVPARARLLIGFAILAGLVAALSSNVLYGAPGGNVWAFAGIAMLASLAVCATVAGAARLAGPVALVTAVLIVVVVGMSASGGPIDYHFLPGFWRAVSGYLPPGAAVAAIRNAAYFDGGVAQPALVLAGWSLLGAALGLAAHTPLARRSAAQPSAAEPAHG